MGWLKRSLLRCLKKTSTTHPGTTALSSSYSLDIAWHRVEGVASIAATPLQLTYLEDELAVIVSMTLRGQATVSAMSMRLAEVVHLGLVFSS